MQLPSKSPSSWSIEEVMQFVRDADPTALAPHAELFRKHVGFPSFVGQSAGVGTKCVRATMSVRVRPFQ